MYVFIILVFKDKSIQYVNLKLNLKDSNISQVLCYAIYLNVK